MHHAHHPWLVDYWPIPTFDLVLNYTVLCLHCEHYRRTMEWSEFGLVVLGLSWLQFGHWALIWNPNGHASAWVHLNIIILSYLNWIILVWAPRLWWSQRMFLIFGWLKMKCDSNKFVRNPCIAKGWKLACEKHEIFSKGPLSDEDKY